MSHASHVTDVGSHASHVTDVGSHASHVTGVGSHASHGWQSVAKDLISFWYLPDAFFSGNSL